MPGALAIGVSYDTFWHLNPRTLAAHQRAYEMLQEVRVKELDYTAWLQGMYFRFSVGSALNGKRTKYPKEPWSRKHATAEIGADIANGLDERVASFKAVAAKINRKNGYT